MRKSIYVLLVVLLLFCNINVCYANEGETISYSNEGNLTNILGNDSIESDSGIEMVTDNNSDNDYAGGCLPTPDEIIDTIPKVRDLDLRTRSSLPLRVDLSYRIPKVGDQGRQNSCVGWATAYYLKTVQESMERNWGVSSNNHIFSPSYVYNQINNGIDGGTPIFSALDLLKEQGVCSIESMPYIQSDYKTQPSLSQREEASAYKIFDYAYIPDNDSDKINKIKNELNSGNLVIIGIDIYPDLDGLNSSNKIYDTISGVSRGGHALCLVGFDNTLNAFKFVNSWGTNWGISGYGYVSYDLIENSSVTFDIYVTYDIIDNQNIIINKNILNLDIGEEFVLTAKVEPKTPGIESYIWKSNNTSIATVDNTGRVTAKSKGSTTISVTEKISGKTASCNVTVYDKIIFASMDTEIKNTSNDTFKVWLKDVKYSDGSSLNNVWFVTWTNNNGQDDLVWHEGVKVQGTNDWVATIKVSEHNNEIGKYITHAYTKRNGQDKYLKGTEYTIENNILHDEVFGENIPIYGDCYKITVKNVRYTDGSYPDIVWFPTWTEKNGQDDIKWNKGTKIPKTNDWEIDIYISDHNKEVGKYITNVYAENDAGRRIICDFNADVSVVEISSGETTYSRQNNNKVKIIVKDVLYSDNTVPYKVMFQTWTEKNGQDDVTWFEGTRIAGTNDWQIIIDKSDHNYEPGKYITHIYARPSDNLKDVMFISDINYNMDDISGWKCIESNNSKHSIGEIIEDIGWVDLTAKNNSNTSAIFESNFEVEAGDRIYLSMESHLSGNDDYLDYTSSFSNASITDENGNIILSLSYHLNSYKTTSWASKYATITEDTAGKLTLHVGVEGTGTKEIDAFLDYVCCEVNGNEV